MVLAAAIGIILAVKQSKIFPIVITFGMSIGVVMVLFPYGGIQHLGFFVYMAFVALAFVYAMFIRIRLTRIVVSLISASTFTYWLWTLNHWHGNTLLFPMLTLLVVLFAIFKKVKLKAELSFIVIMVADAVAVTIELWMKAR